jgi:hypothetical protein
MPSETPLAVFALLQASLPKVAASSAAKLAARFEGGDVRRSGVGRHASKN